MYWDEVGCIGMRWGVLGSGDSCSVCWDKADYVGMRWDMFEGVMVRCGFERSRVMEVTVVGWICNMVA